MKINKKSEKSPFIHNIELRAAKLTRKNVAYMGIRKGDKLE